MTIVEEFKSRNFSIYGQWTGVVCIILCFALGISSIISSFIIWGIIAVVCGLVLIFIEIPLLLRICPTSAKFDTFIRRFSTNYMRAAVYLAMSAAQWTSLIKDPSSLIALAIVLAIAAAFYALAGIKGQDFAGSKTLGGQGLAQMIV